MFYLLHNKFDRVLELFSYLQSILPEPLESRCHRLVFSRLQNPWPREPQAWFVDTSLLIQSLLFYLIQIESSS